MKFILQDEIPHAANVFMDYLPVRGPETQYLDKHGKPETLARNPRIRRFIWEHAQDVHRINHASYQMRRSNLFIIQNEDMQKQGSHSGI